MNRARNLRLLAALLVGVVLVVASSALATHGDPQKKLTAADNARARAMLLRKSDLGPGFTASRDNEKDPDFYCKALDESDLTVTGEAESPDFERGIVFVSSSASLYASVSDANTSWRQGTSAAGERCLRDVLGRELAREGVKLVSTRRLAFPRVAQRTVAYRLQASVDAQGTPVKVTLDVVVLMHSRALVGIVMGSALVAPPRSDEVRLARVIAARMAKAMR